MSSPPGSTILSRKSKRALKKVVKAEPVAAPQKAARPPAPPQLRNALRPFTKALESTNNLPTELEGNRDRWPVAELNSQKLKLAAHFSADLIGADDTGAMHHMVSKDVLADIADALITGYNKAGKQQKQRLGMTAFLGVCRHVAGETVVEQAEQSTHKLLWNLPVNLAVGPASPAEDPGRNFDGDTEPEPSGRRHYTATAQALKAMQDVWDSVRDLDEKPDSAWQDMAGHLLNAFTVSQLKPGTLAAPLTEQWLHDTRSNQIVRRKLRFFPGAAAGLRMFGGARAGVQPLLPHAVVSEAESVREFALNGRPVQLAVRLGPDAIDHVLTRHTFAHFDFANEIKLTNNFWEPALATQDQVRIRLEAVLPEITEILARDIQREGTDPMEVNAAITLGEQQVGNETLFFITAMDANRTGEVELPGPNDTTREIYRIAIDLNTVSPDGVQALSFLGSDLQSIEQRLPKQ